MKLEKITAWLDATLRVADFDDVSNNGLQIDRSSVSEIGQSQITNLKSPNHPISTVAFAVDASVRAVEAAAKAGAQLLVVHHGISWGGGIRRVSGGVGRVIRAAHAANLAVYACHLPLDAHPTLGNNAQLAKLLGLRRIRPAFSYHGNVIGLVGEGLKVRVFEGLKVRVFEGLKVRVFEGLKVREFEGSKVREFEGLKVREFEGLKVRTLKLSNLRTFEPSSPQTLLVGVCSGGAGEFAEEAKSLGCDLYVTGEASWGDVIAAENCGMEMLCLGHYETEVFGVRAVAAAMRKALKLKTVDLTVELHSSPN